MKKNIFFDKIIITPNDIDLNFSPLRENIFAETFVLGAFNPGMSSLPNGNIILMIRIAEALKTPISGKKIHCIRWDTELGFVLDAYNLDEVDTTDPRVLSLKKYLPMRVESLTSISWLLPVELSPDGCEIIKIHYDKIIAPSKSYQEYGIEDARITLIEGTYYMTTCSVSSERLCTTLYTSENGLEYRLKGIILDHQNKDMCLFEGLINHKFYALTRPLGNEYFAPPPQGRFNPGPSIMLAESPDSLHWKPLDQTCIRLQKDKGDLIKLGGGAPPIMTQEGWLVLFHGVDNSGNIGAYRTYWALLDRDEPWKMLHLELQAPLLSANDNLTKNITNWLNVNDVVFTTGIIDNGDHYIVASGELDLCTRITHISKMEFKYGRS